MAIRISGTNVINNSRELVNIGADNLNYPSTDGEPGYAVVTDGSGNLSLQSILPTYITANTNLVLGTQYAVDADDDITLTLPNNPITGSMIKIIDLNTVSNSNYINISRNGNSIMGIDEDLIIDIPGIELILWYNGSDWRLF